MVAKNEEFVIKNYEHLLGDSIVKGKRKCPHCGEYQLSINKNGVKFDCYGCNETKAIAYKLRELNGEFTRDSRKVTPINKYNKAKIKEKECKLSEIVSSINKIFPDLKYNEHDCKPYTENKLFEEAICSPELLYLWLAENHDLDFPKEKVIDALMFVAQQNKFNPLFDYLEECRLDFIEVYDNNFSEALAKAELLVSKLATAYLGKQETLYNIYLRNWLLSAVGRAYSAGCYTRNVLILQGKQNIGKSTFFSILGGEYFCDSLMEAKGKDELMVANSSWIHEWQEVETLWGKKSIGKAKSFISSSKDAVRLPYSRTVSTIKRRFVLCGTTNEDEFLTDRTGNTRFWIIPVDKIELEQLEIERHIILGALATIIQYNDAIAPDDVRTGKLWELSKNEMEISESNNQKFEDRHPFEDIIDSLIDTYCLEGTEANWLLANKIWDELDIPVKERPRHKTKVSQLMKQRGFINGERRIDGKKERVWKKL